jgi:hypothetical protein
LSSEFKVVKGLRQKYAIAPLLFNVVLELWLEDLKQKLGQPYLTNVAYADGMIMGRRWQDVKEVLTSLVEQTNMKGLEVNKKNCNNIMKFLWWKWICKTWYM